MRWCRHDIKEEKIMKAKIDEGYVINEGNVINEGYVIDEG